MQKPQGRSSDGELLKSELDVDRKVANLFIIGRTWKESIASEGSHDIIPLWGSVLSSHILLSSQYSTLSKITLIIYLIITLRSETMVLR